MALTIHRKFIAGVVSAALLVTAVGAGQARAEEDYRTGRTIATILGLAVLGAIINEELEDRSDRRRERAKQPPPQTYQWNGDSYRDGRRPKAHKPPRAKDVRRYALPERCLRRVQTGRGEALVYGRRCMERNYRHVNRLPEWCERRFRTERGTRMGWAARCLRREGYHVARR